MPPVPRKVVVIEDDGEIRDLETFLLVAEGFQVVGVETGAAAAATVKRERADLVLLDFMLPDKDGNAILAELQSDPMTADVPVIVVSAYLSQLRRTPQVRRVVAKPFEITDLLDAVTQELDQPKAC
jgi:CheY-like chemotaxis protein